MRDAGVASLLAGGLAKKAASPSKQRSGRRWADAGDVYESSIRARSPRLARALGARLVLLTFLTALGLDLNVVSIDRNDVVEEKHD